MPFDTQRLSEKPLSEILGQTLPTRPNLRATKALVEKLPFALTYTANLEPRDRAILFYDNLSAAAEYFCAFIEEGIRRQETTCLTGLDPSRYQALFDQVGVKVAELENCGYLRNLTTNNLHEELEQINRNRASIETDDPIRTRLENEPNGIRFIHIQTPPNNQDTSIETLRENERRTHRLSSVPTTSICCYDAKLALQDTPSDFFKETLRTHDHCLFQGAAMPTSKLLGLETNSVYPKLRST